MNTTLNSKPFPFLLKPAAKDYLWGGQRLNDDFGKNIDLDPLAETWECSTHPDGLSIVASGEFAGMTLDRLLELYPEFIGPHPSVLTAGHVHETGRLPILIKLIDAKSKLSVQVHPNDEYASIHENGSLGKTELWYVLDAVGDASIVRGLKENLSGEQIRTHIAAGNLEQYLQHIRVNKNDLYFIEPGTVHAIGAGCLIAEIQESSNITYRLFDYDRSDKNGNKRDLHIEKALDVADLTAKPEPVQPMRVLKYKRGFASELLYRCKYFQLERMLLNTENLRELVTYSTEMTSFQVLLCVDGCGTLFTEDNAQFLRFFKGDCIFIPAGTGGFKLHGNAQMLKVRC